MEKNVDCVRLVREAQLGDKECLERLAKLAEQSLHDDVYRMTLENDLTQDIVQETILEMLKILGELEEADRFWPWLYKIALNKIRLHRRAQKRRPTVPISAVPGLEEQKNGQEAMSDLAAKELKQIIFRAMWQLKPQHRAVLTMRCYKEMGYSVIGEAMGCTEFTARKMFWRAKKALRKQLARQGFGKGSLLMALFLFGKMTASSEAAAAKVSVSAATTKVGVTAALVGIASSKTAVLSLATAGALGAGALVATSGPDTTTGVSSARPATSSHAAGQVSQMSKANEEWWYYYPSNANGAVMMRFKSDGGGGQSCSQWLQSNKANYHKRKNTIYVDNYRMWASDLAVQRLPADSPQLTEFLSQVEGKRETTEYVPYNGDGLLVVRKRNENGIPSQLTHYHDVLDEEYFRYDWPADVKMVDNRDAMHKRGWTYFRITGWMDGQRVSGEGRIPFVYAASEQYRPWLRLQVRNRLKIVDVGSEAIFYDGRGRVMASYAGGSFFKGLSRPWMGLHTIDTVRRDAAEQRVWFETKYEPKEGKAEVELSCEQGKLVYTIDMKKDVIDRVTILGNDGRKGELRFSYLQDIGEAGREFAEPRISRSYGSKRRASPGMLWLTKLITGY